MQHVSCMQCAYAGDPGAVQRGAQRGLPDSLCQPQEHQGIPQRGFFSLKMCTRQFCIVFKSSLEHVHEGDPIHLHCPTVPSSCFNYTFQTVFIIQVNS